MRGSIPPIPQYLFMAWCLVKHRDNFTFTFYIYDLLISSSACLVVAMKLKDKQAYRFRAVATLLYYIQ